MFLTNDVQDPSKAPQCIQWRMRGGAAKIDAGTNPVPELRDLPDVRAVADRSDVTCADNRHLSPVVDGNGASPW